MSDPLRRMVRRLPVVRRRDEQLASANERLSGLEAQVRELRRERRDAEQRATAAARQRTAPSFLVRLEAEKRLVTAGNEIGSTAPRHLVSQKLRARAIARGCGVEVPEIRTIWEDARSVDLSALPDEFVLKSAGGAGSHGVFPLRRTPGGYQVVTRETTYTEPDLVARLADLAGRGVVDPPFFAEEFLHGTTGDEIPVDIKLYAFYGVVSHAQLRRVGRHGDLHSVTWRFVDRDGDELSQVAVGRRIDPGIPTPADLPLAVAAAERLSLATRLPFVRVDLYETGRGIVFGELTPRPGGQQRFTPEHDRWLGELWEQAQARLERDVANGMPYAHDLGGHEGDPYVGG